MSATITATNTTTTQQRTDRKISFSWVGNIQKAYSTGNGALVRVGYQVENTTKTGWLNETFPLENNANSSFNTNSSGTYLSPNPYVSGTTYVDVRVIARTITSGGTVSDTQVMRIYLTDTAPQTVTLTPDGGSASIVTGQTFNGTASGAQGGNAYNIAVISGTASASINATTGAYTVTAGATAGLVSYSVWASAGNGYSRSSDVTGVLSVTLSKKVTVTIPANNGPQPIQYELRQGGSLIGTRTQMPGDTAIIQQIDVGANAGEVTVTSKVLGVVADGTSYVVSDNPTDSIPTETETTVIPSNDPATPPAPVTPPPAAQAITQTKPSSQGGVVWSAGNGSQDPAEQKDLLTNQVYREGATNVVKAVFSLSTLVSELLTTTKDKDTAEQDLADDRPTASDMQTQGDEAKADSENAVLGALDGSIANTTAPAKSGSSMTLNGGASFMGFTSTVSTQWLALWAYLDPIFTWIREIIRWLVVVTYTLWVFEMLNRQLSSSLQLGQAKGNPVLGGTGGQATTLLSAAAITGVLLTLPVGLWAVYATNLPVGVLLTVAAAPLESTHPSVPIAMGWLATALPIDTLLQIAPVVIIVKKYSLALIHGVAALIRFIAF